VPTHLKAWEERPLTLQQRNDGVASIDYYPLTQNTCYYDAYEAYHRLDGPAVEYKDGTSEWFYHGEKIHCSSLEEFERILKMKAFW
jgi:hypothetical protein